MWRTPSSIAMYDILNHVYYYNSIKRRRERLFLLIPFLHFCIYAFNEIKLKQEIHSTQSINWRSCNNHNEYWLDQNIYSACQIRSYKCIRDHLIHSRSRASLTLLPADNIDAVDWLSNGLVDQPPQSQSCIWRIAQIDVVQFCINIMSVCLVCLVGRSHDYISIYAGLLH